MNVAIRIVVQSHINDAKIEIDFNKELALTRLDFISFLTLKYGDANMDSWDLKIDPSADYQEFLEKGGQHVEA